MRRKTLECRVAVCSLVRQAEADLRDALVREMAAWAETGGTAGAGGSGGVHLLPNVLRGEGTRRRRVDPATRAYLAQQRTASLRRRIDLSLHPSLDVHGTWATAVVQETLNIMREKTLDLSLAMGSPPRVAISTDGVSASGEEVIVNMMYYHCLEQAVKLSIQVALPCHYARALLRRS